MSIGIVMAAVFGGSFVVIAAMGWRATHTPLTEEERAAQAGARVGLPAPAADNVAGVRTDWADECALILSLPEYQAGADRLLDAIREQQEGEQP
ncbi:hypothetical protein AB0M11_26360 [Streptomyces sp. NPDC051987]|uniref:hypothetical protein n=1 Tax=Streptomyces sp. NPDC051987 TaxID=3155808 RepID=UPI00342B6F52